MAKYQCDIPGLEDNFVELSDRWSREQIIIFQTGNLSTYREVVEKKIIDSRLTCPDNEPVAGKFLLSDEVLDRIDFELVPWLGGILTKHVNGLGELGEASARRLFVSTETNSDQASDAPTQS